MTPSIIIHGTCHPAFVHVRDAFRENFTSRGEVGAAVAVYQDGQKVVDLWGGVADPQTGKPWDRDTIVCMMSVGKAMAALCILRLVDRGEIDLEAPVARYWPEFAEGGKDAVTVRLLLSGLAGLIYADAAPDGSAYDHAAMATALAAQVPVWAPGSQGAYHSMTMGSLLNELCRRVDGRSIDVFFAEEIAGPLGIGYKFGLRDADMGRVARVITNPGSVTLQQIGDPASKLGRAWRILPNKVDFFNDDAFRRTVFPSANGHGSARDIARIYAALGQGGRIGGYHLLSPALIEEIRTPAWEGVCGLTDREFRYGLGFFLSSYPLSPFGPNTRAFGQPGAGGALGCVDPEAGIALSYSPNRMCAGAGLGDRSEALVAAVFG